MKILKRIVLIILITIIVVLVIGAISVYGVWHNELSTVTSFKQLKTRNDSHDDGSIYEMTVSGDYYFDEFIEQGGVSNDKELISFVTNKITKGLLKLNIGETEIACSAFTAKTEDGDYLFARNYDFAKTNTCIVKTSPKGRHASVSTVDLQFLGIDCNSDVSSLMDKMTCLAAPYAPLDGINDAGVSCGIFMSYQGLETTPTNQNTNAPDITSTTMLRLVLDYADSVEEAVELISKYDLHDSAGTSYHYMIADATGKSAILEWVYGTDITDNDGSKRELVVTYNDNDARIGSREEEANYQWITNFIIEPNYYEDDTKKAGWDRYNTLYDGLSKTNGIVKDEQAAMDILASVGRRSYGTGGNGTTVHSAVYNLTKKTSYWIGNEHFDDVKSKYYYSL